MQKDTGSVWPYPDMDRNLWMRVRFSNGEVFYTILPVQYPRVRQHSDTLSHANSGSDTLVHVDCILVSDHDVTIFQKAPDLHDIASIPQKNQILPTNAS